MVMGPAMSWRAEEAAQSSKLGAGGAGLGQGAWFPAEHSDSALKLRSGLYQGS